MNAVLLHSFLTRREEIVERIQALLNAQRKPAAYLQDTGALAHDFEQCFPARVLRELEDALWADGFRPRDIPGLHNGPADAAELMARAFYMWQQTRWPGRNGRVRYAHTLFNLHIVRCLELLSMRLWDDESSAAGERLAELQSVLDALWKTNPGDQPALVKDTRWLIQTAQSLATDDLGAYFRAAQRIAGSFSDDDGREIHKAGVRMAGGHLRSQIRYHATKKAASLDEATVVLATRESNALDFALLVQELVPLLDEYEQAIAAADEARRIDLADVICQGISPDPELFVNRVDLLGPFSMIEHLFITTDAAGRAGYTPMGQRHVRVLQQYSERIARMAKPLREDCERFRPSAGTYSPYGVLYGFSADLMKHMVLKASQPDAEIRFTLEDVFSAGGADKLAWISGWRKLPHLPKEMERLFEYPQQFAEDVFERIARALRAEAAGPAEGGHSLERQLEPESYDERQLLNDRREGKLLVSYQTAGGWRAVRKSALTDGTRALTAAGLPAAAADVLKLMCPTLSVGD